MAVKDGKKVSVRGGGHGFNAVAITG